MPQILEKTTSPRPKPKAPSQKVIDRLVKEAVDEAVSEVGTKKLTCYLCGHLHPVEKFYVSTDPMCHTGRTRVCRDCVESIVYSIGPDKVKHPPTKESIQMALEYLDKPYFEKLYEASVLEAANTMSGKTKNNVWTSYIKNVSMKNYNMLRWKDGDIGHSTTFVDIGPIDNSDEVRKMYEVNKRTVISALGYDPFESAAETDKPLMYSKLVGFLDESTQEDELKLGACVEIVHSLNQSEKLNTVINSLQRTTDSIVKNAATIESTQEDELKLGACVEIVHSLNQSEKLNTVINSLQRTTDSIVKNAATIKALEATKKDIMKTTLDLARDNGISIKHSNRNTKGAHTLTGKLKQLKQSDLRSKEMNLFDVNTAEGMQQVANISFEAIMKQLSLDENDYTNMIATQKTMIKNLQEELAVAKEECRLYRRERNDLRELCEEKKLINEKGEIIYE